jgi:hypothetical protein
MLIFVTATTTAKALSVSGLPRGDKAPTRNDDHCHGKNHDNTTAKFENSNGILEPATPHSALSRKGRGDDTTRQRQRQKLY